MPSRTSGMLNRASCGGHAEMTGHGQFQRPAQDVAGHRGHDRLGRILDFLKSLLKDPRRADGILVAANLLENGQIGPRAKMLWAAGNDDGPDFRLLVGPTQERTERVEQRKADRVDRRGLETDDRQAVAYGVVEHSVSSLVAQPPSAVQITSQPGRLCYIKPQAVRYNNKVNFSESSACCGSAYISKARAACSQGIRGVTIDVRSTRPWATMSMAVWK